ncbi:hypothetical protein AK812_SmicGene40435 [Symbiodinium microadriaticum]|uniref:Uncharacterized protein n=1 Tax=Symbiodinium microadriaticum TaxID=2951 RepID=A0A1Q9C8N4_SYMMI|nr:hypothetical protein AK812_SmicGene40435 [Symbiodinium microadriaticum]CAE7832218.1 unnamed protein product [Symbiodinium microadriaticum]
MASKRKAWSLSADTMKSDSVPTQSLGPASLKELYLWPQHLLSKLMQRGDGRDSDRCARLQSLLARRVLVTSDYSGLSGEYEIFHQMKKPLKEFMLPQPGHELCFHHSKVCDNGSVQMQALTYLSEVCENGSMCVMKDINDRLHPSARSYLDALMPGDDCDLATAAEAYKCMGDWLMANHDWAISETCRCVMHEQDCPLYALPDVNTECARGVLRLNFAGTTCRGWSKAGKMRYFSDPSERPHAVWLCDRVRESQRTASRL